MALVLSYIRRLLSLEMITDSSYRHALIEDVMESRLGRIINLVPFILIMALASLDVTLALWTAFGVELVLLALQFYRSRYNPRVAFPLVISVAQLIAFIVLLVLAYTVTAFNWRLCTPIIVTFMFVVAAASLAICKPFTMQVVSKITDEATWRSPEFLRTHQLLTGLWVATFGLMTLSVWIAFGVYPNSQSAGYVGLGIVVPIVLPILVTVFISYQKNVMEWEDKLRKGAGEAGKEDEGESERLLEKA